MPSVMSTMLTGTNRMLHGAKKPFLNIYHPTHTTAVLRTLSMGYLY